MSDVLTRAASAAGGGGDTCTLPNGEKPFSFGLSPRTLIVLVPFLACLPLMSYLFLPWLGTTVGWYLRRKTEGRRARIIEVLEEDERAFQAKRLGEKQKGGKAGGSGSGDEDDGWENIEAATAGSAGIGEKGNAGADFSGIVGFFHPFW